jgi:hypothetical protein
MQNYLKLTLPIFAVSLILTLILYVLFVLTDLIMSFSNAALLLNIDFLVNYKYINIFEELLIHFLITLTIVLMTFYVYRNFQDLKVVYLCSLMTRLYFVISYSDSIIKPSIFSL